MNVVITSISWIFFAVLFVYLALVIMTFLFQRNMMYFPSGYLPISKSAIENITEVKITTKGDTTLMSWYLPAKDNKETIISFHGNASTMEWQSKRLLPFAAQGYGVLIASYRGYNGNAGKANEEGLYDDAAAHIEWLKAQGVQDDKIILYGESLGTGVAVEMAARAGRSEQKFHALILESPYTSTVDVAKKIYPFLPISLLMKDRFESLSKIKDVKTPIVIAHGRLDAVVPYLQGQELFAAANHPKYFIDIADGAHANLGDFRVTQKYLEILNSNLKGD